MTTSVARSGGSSGACAINSGGGGGALVLAAAANACSRSRSFSEMYSHTDLAADTRGSSPRAAPRWMSAHPSLKLTCSCESGRPGAPRGASSCAVSCPNCWTDFCPESQTRAGLGCQSLGVSGKAHLLRQRNPSVDTHQVSFGTPLGSSRKPANTGRPSCHRSVLEPVRALSPPDSDALCCPSTIISSPTSSLSKT